MTGRANAYASHYVYLRGEAKKITLPRDLVVWEGGDV